MSKLRIERINSLLKEVISEVVTRNVKNPFVSTLVTIIRVDVSNDLHHAKVYTSVIGSPEEKKKTIDALQSAAGFIAVQASKKVVLRYFPSLLFKLDSSVEEQARIDDLLTKIKKERESRKVIPTEDDSNSL